MPQRDEGMRLALEGAGGPAALARGLKVARCNVRWRRAPRNLLLEIARVSGVDAEVIRPDLASWVRLQRQTALLDRARARFGLSGPATVKGPKEPSGAVLEIFEIGLTVAAIRFAAAERGLVFKQVLMADHHGAAEQSARAYGMALAHIAGRVSSTTVGVVVGCSRQNVENAAHRYERARDGDGEDAENGKVIERGRVRRAKTANDALWDAERRFLEGMEL